MLGLLVPMLACGLLGALRVRSFAGLGRMHIHLWPLALASIAVQLVLFSPPVDRQSWALSFGPAVWVICLLALIAVLVRNGLFAQPGRSGLLLAALGVAVNLFVVLANGGYMPQSTEARLMARGTPLIVEGAPPQLRNVTPAASDSRFLWLGDVIAEPAWLPTANVLSIGDVLLASALGWWALKLATTAEVTQERRSLADSH